MCCTCVVWFHRIPGPGEHEIGLEVGHLLYMGEGQLRVYDDIRIFQVSSLVVVAAAAAAG